ncbi:MAG: hypothetical protein ABR912_06100 [Terracidiphilus sp.]|jgi:hypothetical protein
MIRLTTLASGLVFVFAAGLGWAAPSPPGSQQSGSAGEASTVTLPAGTKVGLAVTGPVWARTVKLGYPLDAQTNFPVTVGDSIAIPAGTYVEGKIEAVTQPTRKTSRAEIQILFTKIIFANGYTIVLPENAIAQPMANGMEAAPAPAADGAALDAGSAPTAALVTVEVSTANDLLLDNGAQIEMTLAAPLALEAKQIASAVPLSRPPQPGSFKSATLCRFIPGTPGSAGSPDTVIPGSPGTPSITVPGGPGMPDTVIPGTPATPDTVIPGSPGSPGTPDIYCPAAPIVISSVPVSTTAAQSQSTPTAAR